VPNIICLTVFQYCLTLNFYELPYERENDKGCVGNLTLPYYMVGVKQNVTKVCPNSHSTQKEWTKVPR